MEGGHRQLTESGREAGASSNAGPSEPEEVEDPSLLDDHVDMGRFLQEVNEQ